MRTIEDKTVNFASQWLFSISDVDHKSPSFEKYEHFDAHTFRKMVTLKRFNHFESALCPSNNFLWPLYSLNEKWLIICSQWNFEIPFIFKFKMRIQWSSCVIRNCFNFRKKSGNETWLYGNIFGLNIFSFNSFDPVSYAFY